MNNLKKKMKMRQNFFLYSLSLILVFFSCSNDSDGGNERASDTGVGGSMARFAIKNDHLYIVDDENLKIFDISNPNDPIYKNEERIGMNIETIFPKDSLLFIGSQNGMFIYDITNPISPKQLSTFSHVRSCDPVVASDDYAYVTLRTDNIWCGRNNNELQIIDIKNIYSPKHIKSYNMISPKGLGIDGNILFVCDDSLLKVLDVSDPKNVITLYTITNINANDLIVLNGLLMVIGDDGLTQYAYQDGELTELSKISIEK